jgi:hypothetical protein
MGNNAATSNQRAYELLATLTDIGDQQRRTPLPAVSVRPDRRLCIREQGGKPWDLWRFWQSAKLMFGKFSPAPAFADSNDQPECVGDSRFFQNAARI